MTDRQTEKGSDGEIDRQTGKGNDRQTEKDTNRQARYEAKERTEIQIDKFRE